MTAYEEIAHLREALRKIVIAGDYCQETAREALSQKSVTIQKPKDYGEQ